RPRLDSHSLICKKISRASGRPGRRKKIEVVSGVGCRINVYYRSVIIDFLPSKRNSNSRLLPELENSSVKLRGKSNKRRGYACVFCDLEMSCKIRDDYIVENRLSCVWNRFGPRSFKSSVKELPGFGNIINLGSRLSKKYIRPTIQSGVAVRRCNQCSVVIV